MEFITAYNTKMQSMLQGPLDRFHIRFNTGDEWMMSSNADSPQGICYYNGLFYWSTPVGAFEVPYEELPEGVKRQIEYLEAASHFIGMCHRRYEHFSFDNVKQLCQ
jgi:hypothetical protein